MTLPVALSFEWRRLLFANWPVDPGVVTARLPDALSVDTYDGDAWLSVVPFVNVDTRPRGLPAALGLDLPELNLRTYVTRDGEPGVYFFSLDMESVAGVLGARLTHHLPYYYARMTVEDVDGGDGIATDGDRVRVTSRRRHPGDRPARYEATYGPTGDRFEADAGSLAAFLTDRLRLYTQASDGSVRYTDVDHGPWPLYEAEYEECENTLFEANGFDRPETEPTLYYSPGVSVTTTRSKRWDGRA
jgi:uncharacterized protein YqjF (DUF2071 family)